LARAAVGCFRSCQSIAGRARNVNNTVTGFNVDFGVNLDYFSRMKQLGLFVCISAVGALAAWAAAQTSYHLARTFKIGGEGGWDMLAVDNANRHLFVSHASQVEVIDLENGKLIKAIKNTPGVHGIAIASKLDRGFITCGSSNEVVVFDLKSLNILSRVPVGTGPDAILFDPFSKRIFTIDRHGASVTVIDAATGSVVGTIPDMDMPESAVADGMGAVFVPLENKDVVVRIDTATMKVTATWPLAPCKSPSSMAMDQKSHRLFVGCHSELMVVVDVGTGRVVAQAPIAPGVDDSAFDSKSAMVFETAIDGRVTIIHEDSANTYSVVGTVATATGARNIALDPKTHNLYLSVADFGPAPAPTKNNPTPRPSIVPDTFRVLEIVP
jgi:DNA-binding beta-propeller fold protein YncE